MSLCEKQIARKGRGKKRAASPSPPPPPNPPSSFKHVLPGRCIQEIAFEGTSILAQLEHHKLVKFLRCKTKFNESMVNEFYASLNVDFGTEMITACVNNTHISLSCTEFGNIFELNMEGFGEFQVMGLPEVGSIDKIHAFRKYIQARTSPYHNNPIKIDDYSYELRIILRLIQLSILPTSRKDHYVSEYDQFLGYMLLNSEPINMCAVILANMLSAKKRNVMLPYGMALGYLFEHLGIPCEGFRLCRIDAQWYFNLLTLARMEIFIYNDKHINLKEFESLPKSTQISIKAGIRGGYLVGENDEPLGEEDVHADGDLADDVDALLADPMPDTSQGVGTSRGVGSSRPSSTQPGCGNSIFEAILAAEKRIMEAMAAEFQSLREEFRLSRSRSRSRSCSRAPSH